MKETIIKPDSVFVLKLFDWYRDAMIGIGRSVSLSKTTDPTKTYTFRAISKFAQKVIEWDFDDDTVRLLINTAVRYANCKGLLKKGAFLLTMPSVLDACCNELQNQVSMTEWFASAIGESHKFIESIGINTSGKVRYNKVIKYLSKSVCFGGSSGIVYHYNTGDICLPYIALSKICNNTIKLVYDRDELPDNINLMRLRIKLLSNNDNLETASKTLGDDLFIHGVGVRVNV